DYYCAIGHSSGDYFF
nr:immunoglobulin light chain junction region [Macaca mulatta]MOX28798.1 immunoglobulin light chain junction region [Macaca mulatta]MOX29053.1 immunoglobulin light chain junction region [Macaca mulatta]MOX29800.1 immunoglobulin light chain junction region [Macaca mulatta]MOX29943.1 immunoglobulin light chain junction region [Macaca mulatta]